MHFRMIAVFFTFCLLGLNYIYLKLLVDAVLFFSCLHGSSDGAVFNFLHQNFIAMAQLFKLDYINNRLQLLDNYFKTS